MTEKEISLRMKKFINLYEKFERLFPNYSVIGFDPSFLIMSKDHPYLTMEIPLYFMEELLSKLEEK